jgi:hypothetical protein
MTRPKPFLTKDVNNISESVSKNLKVAKGVFKFEMALRLSCSKKKLATKRKNV